MSYVMTDDSAIRRENLRLLIREKFEDNRAAFARATGKNPNMINLMLSHNPELQRPIGERVARRIEMSLSLPDKWLDVARVTPDIGTMYTLPVVRLDRLESAGTEKLVLGADIVSRHLDRPTAVANIRACYMPSNEMAPAISRDDLMLIDTGAKEFNSDGVYVIVRDKDVFVRRVRRQLAGGIRISADASPEDAIDATGEQFVCAGRVAGLLKFSAA